MPLHSAALIDPQLRRLREDFGLYPCTATEVEFYLHGSHGQNVESCYSVIAENAAKAGIGIANIEAERGQGQHEISLLPLRNPLETAADHAQLLAIIRSAAELFGFTADFTAKPLADQPGSGLHVHVHLENSEGESQFYKRDDVISEMLKYSIGGLLAWMPASIAICAPHAASYARFVAGGNSPTTISWGANNRTVAIRLPDAAPNHKHIEHRVAGADADAGRVLAIMLAAMHYGIANKCEPAAQIYGDASLDMYGLPKFPASREEALAAFNGFAPIGDYFSAADLLPAS